MDDENKIYRDYFLASLEPFKDLEFMNQTMNLKLLDIGSGSGIPGVLLKIIFKDLKVSLLDANKKKTDFLKALISHLELKDCEVIYERAEACAFKMNEQFDLVTSRAVSELRKILELSVRFLKVDGYLIQPKGEKGEEELKDALQAIHLLHLELVLEKKTEFFHYTHYLFVFKKLSSTDSKYPRL